MLLDIPPGALAHRTTWDANLEVGGGFVWSDKRLTNLLVRGRGGVMFVRDTIFTMVGATYEYSLYSPATFGAQAEVLSLDKGLWAQGGAFVDIHGHAGGDVSVGFSLIGLEFQYRAFEGHPAAPALYLKLEIPIGVIGYGLSRGH